jgi:hypothetical protein
LRPVLDRPLGLSYSFWDITIPYPGRGREALPSRQEKTPSLREEFIPDYGSFLSSGIEHTTSMQELTCNELVWRPIDYMQLNDASAIAPYRYLQGYAYTLPSGIRAQACGSCT